MALHQDQADVRAADRGGVSGLRPGNSAHFVPRHRRGERGQSVVEFAMVLPLLAALVFVLINFGKALYYYIELTHVANEGARIATVSQTSVPGGGNLAKYLCSQLGGSGSELRTGSRPSTRPTSS